MAVESHDWARVRRDVPGGSGSDWGRKGSPRVIQARLGSRGRSQRVWVVVGSQDVSHGDLGRTGVARAIPGGSGQRGTEIPRGV